MCEKNCLNCQFFSVCGDHPVSGFWMMCVTQKERSRIKENNTFIFLTECLRSDRTHLRCYKGVWDEQKLIREINKWGEPQFRDKDREKPKEKLWEIIVVENRDCKNSRGNSCFYLKFQEGMQLEAADELEKRETLQKDAAADRKWVKWGVLATFITTAIAAVVSLVLFIWSHYWKS